MDQATWAAELTARIAAELKKQRAAKGLTAEALSEACSALGFPISRLAISRLESGRRSAMEIAEFLVLAQALDIPPVSLAFPLTQGPTTHMAPLVETSTWEAATWFTGENALASPAPAGTPRADLDAFRRHDRLVRTALLSYKLAAERRQEAQTTVDAQEFERVNRAARQLEAIAHQDQVDLLAARRALREQGLFPPPLPQALAFIDPEPA